VDRCADCGVDDSAARREQIHNESLQQAGLLRVDYAAVGISDLEGLRR
jgi:hypothetical protein